MSAFSRFFLFCFPLFILAADDKTQDPTSLPSVEEQISVAADRRETRVKESTSSVTVISDEDIARQMVADSRDLIRYVPGVTISNDPTRLGLNGFNIRGIGENRTATLVDGVKVGEQFDFGPLSVHRFTVDPDTLKRVEIVKSASSSLYGSDALGGLVFMETKGPEDYLSPGGRTGYLAKTSYQGRNEATRLGLHFALESGAGAWLFSGTFRNFGDMENQGKNQEANGSRTAPNPLDGRNTQLQLKRVWRPSANNRIQLSLESYKGSVETEVLHLQGTTSEFGSTVNTSAYSADDRQERETLILEQDLLLSDVLLADHLEWRLFGRNSETLQNTREQRLVEGSQAPSQIERLGTMTFDQETFGAEFRLIKTLNRDRGEHYFSYGLTYEHETFEQLRDRVDNDLITGEEDVYQGTLTLPTRYFPPSNIDRVGAYVQYEGKFLEDRLKVTPSLRYDHYRLNPDKNDAVYNQSVGVPPEKMAEDFLSPKIGILYKTSENTLISGLYATGFRAPPYSSVNSGFTNYASGYATLPNPDLDPEIGENLEFRFEWFGRRGSLNLTYFDNHFEDFIQSTFIGVNAQGTALFQERNVEDVAVDGIEIQALWILSESWRVHGAFAAIEGRNESDQLPLDSVPPNQGVLGLHWMGRRFSAQVNGNFVSAKKSSDLADPSTFNPSSYTTFDFTARAALNRGLTLQVGVFNLGDETFYVWPDVLGRPNGDPAIERYSAPGRNLSISLSYKH